VQYDTDAVEDAVLSVLDGSPVTETAARIGWSPERLGAAVELYCTAGRAALDVQPEPSEWLQVNIEFADYATAGRAFRAYLLPSLLAATAGGVAAGWWFVCKYPCWRLRVTPREGVDVADMAKGITEALDATLSWGVARRWWTVPYEPETYAFGGTDGMGMAHKLFHEDSVGILGYQEHTAAGPGGLLSDAKATSLLLLTLFLRAAGLEWSEQGDVWARVEAKRPMPEDVTADQVTALSRNLRKLLMVDASGLLEEGGQLVPISAWITGLESAGRGLAEASREGQLSTGVRGILARHVLFHWNRMGFTARQQGIWARAAREAILGD
jgi:thiopeptide-type bacteriocin biosynthesis protein